MTSLTLPLFLFFFFNDTATTEIYTLSLHDALPICAKEFDLLARLAAEPDVALSRETLMSEVWDEHWFGSTKTLDVHRSEEHTSELQSRQYLVCRLLLEKKKK